MNSNDALGNVRSPQRKRKRQKLVRATLSQPSPSIAIPPPPLENFHHKSLQKTPLKMKTQATTLNREKQFEDMARSDALVAKKRECKSADAQLKGVFAQAGRNEAPQLKRELAETNSSQKIEVQDPEKRVMYADDGKTLKAANHDVILDTHASQSSATVPKDSSQKLPKSTRERALVHAVKGGTDSEEENLFKRKKVVVDDEEDISSVASDATYTYPCCGVTSGGGFSFGCEKCDGWWHYDCLQWTYGWRESRLQKMQAAGDKAEPFYCPTCVPHPPPKKKKSFSSKLKKLPPPRKRKKATPKRTPKRRKKLTEFIPLAEQEFIDSSSEEESEAPKCLFRPRTHTELVPPFQKDNLKVIPYDPETDLFTHEKESFYRDESEEAQTKESEKTITSTLNENFKSGIWVLSKVSRYPLQLYEPCNGNPDCAKWVARNDHGSVAIRVNDPCTILTDFGVIYGALEKRLPDTNISRQNFELTMFLVCLLYERNQRFTMKLVDGIIAERLNLENRQLLYCYLHRYYGEDLVVCKGHELLSEKEVAKLKAKSEKQANRIRRRNKKRQLNSGSDDEDEFVPRKRRKTPSRKSKTPRRAKTPSKRRKTPSSKEAKKSIAKKKRRKLNESDDDSDMKEADVGENIEQDKGRKQKTIEDFFTLRRDKASKVVKINERL